MKKNYFFKGDNYNIEFEINDWAERSLISLLTKGGDTFVFTVINLGQETLTSDFLPLTVDYEEKFYAAGKIFGSRFVRREGKPTINSILNARLIDRSLRPAFHSYFRKQIQIVNTVLSYSPEVDPAFLALLGSSFGLQVLKLPVKPIAGIKLIFDQNNWQIDLSEKGDNFQGKIFVSGTKNKINMIEFEGQEVKNSEIVKSCQIAHQEIRKIISFMEENLGNGYNEEILDLENFKKGETVVKKFLEKENIDLEKIIFSKKEDKGQFQEIFEIIAQEDFGDLTPYVVNSLNNLLKKAFQENVLKKKVRPDGRKMEEIRPLEAAISLLPRVHGSAFFKRGLTHIISTVTLGVPGEELILREIEYEGLKHFIHHYNFPPYSTGEIGVSKGPSRREIGHGEIVEKSLRSLIPSQDKFPYTIRVVSDVLSSNGSTSMGSVCASSLALMDAGVPLKNHVAGISVGLVFENDDNYELLTDIQGPEDFFGAMDFKVAGTDKGITSIQLDVKIEGLNFEQIERALVTSDKARKEILSFMKKIIPQPKKEVSQFAPKVDIIKVDPLKIGLIIGSGGRTINEIITTTNTKIDINPDGLIYISSDNYENISKAKNWIKIITESLAIGDLVQGKIIKILASGAILELTPQRTAWLHISEIADRKIENINDELKIGDELRVLVKNITPDGKIYVSLKDVRRRKRQ